MNKFLIWPLLVSFVFYWISQPNTDQYNAAEIISKIAHFVLYLSIIKCAEDVTSATYKSFKTGSRENLSRVLLAHNKTFIAILISAVVLIATAKSLFEMDFVLLTVAVLATKYPEMSTRRVPSVGYGEGMACSFYEGYLTYVLPAQGSADKGIVENIAAFEASERVRFPVKRLFLVITRSLYCPPDLAVFNKNNAEERGESFLEACMSLQDVTKDVAGVKKRVYRNSVYKIRRGGLRLHVAAECATPLHTMHRVMDKRALFPELQHADFDEIREDFCRMLRKILEMPACRGLCELVYYDDKDPNQNLADIILERVKELEPDFEKIMEQ